MGMVMNQEQDQKDAQRRRRARGRQEPADWAGVDPVLLLATVAAVGSKGGALRLGYSRDGGSYAIGVYGDGSPYTEWLRPSDDIEQYFKDLIEDTADWEVPDWEAASKQGNPRRARKGKGTPKVPDSQGEPQRPL